MLESMTPKDLTAKFQKRLPLYTSLKDEVTFAITRELESANIKFHSVTARVKSIESLCAKMDAKRILDPLREVVDIVGARVVALFLSDIDKIVDRLRSCFDVHLVDNKIGESDPARFGYFSVHLHAKIRQSFSGSRYDHLKDQVFEIQVRTIAMDAWATASHHLSYKSESDIPDDLKRDFHALSGLYYIADKHFEMFFRSSALEAARLEKKFKANQVPDSTRMSFHVLQAFLKERYPDRHQPDGGLLSDLLAEIEGSGLLHVGLLRERLEHGEKDLFTREEYDPLSLGFVSSDGGDFKPISAVGVVRMILRGL